MKIYSRTKKRPTEASPTGKMTEDTYSIEIDLKGHKTLTKSGETNIYDKIQESHEETKIENIIRRAVGGDETALAVMHGTYADVTKMPKSLAEMQQQIIKATQEFEKLPLELRRQFNHSVEEYIAEYGSKEWGDKIQPFLPQQPDELQQKQAAEKLEVKEEKAE